MTSKKSRKKTKFSIFQKSLFLRFSTSKNRVRKAFDSAKASRDSPGKIENFDFFNFFLTPYFSLFPENPVYYYGYWGLSLVKISSRFEKPVKSYVEPTSQMQKKNILKPRGEKSLMIK